MKTLFLFGGNSVHNRTWIEQVQQNLGGVIHSYKHWANGTPFVDLQMEAERLVCAAKGNPIDVFAKSAGCLVVMKAVREMGLKVRQAVFVGVAVEWGIERGIPVRAWLRDWQTPTLFVHKEQDYVIAAQDLRPFVKEHQTLLVLPGDDHDYLEFDHYLPQVREVFR